MRTCDVCAEPLDDCPTSVLVVAVPAKAYRTVLRGHRDCIRSYGRHLKHLGVKERDA